MSSLRRGLFVLLCVSLLTLVIGGCLDRHEGVTIHEDGSVTVVHEISGDGGDLDGGASWLPIGEGFTVKRSVEKQKDGKVKHRAVATATYPSVEEMPESFCPEDDPLYETSLRFTSRLYVDETPNGKRYTFARRYFARDWGRYALERARAFPDPVEELLDSGPLDKLARRDQEVVLAAFADYERRKLHVWLERALEDVELPQSIRLQAMLAGGKATDTFHDEQLIAKRLVELLELPKKQLEVEADELMTKWWDATISGVVAMMGEYQHVIPHFRDRFALHRHDFEVSDDLRDENFKFVVTMPGKIQRANGSIDGEQVSWSFSGKELCKSDRWLVVESFVSSR